MPRDLARPRQRLDDLGGYLCCILGLLQALQRHHELVAAQPRQRVSFADTALHAVGHLLEQQVADLVAERIVDVLEAIEIDEQQRQRLPGAARCHDALLQAVVEQHAIGQFGQRIARGQVADAGLGGLAIGDVAAGAALAEALSRSASKVPTALISTQRVSP